MVGSWFRPRDLRSGVLSYLSAEGLSTLAGEVRQSNLEAPGLHHPGLGSSARADLTASMNRRTLSGSLRPGDDSTPLATSTIHGRTIRSRSATFSGVRPPARMRQG